MENALKKCLKGRLKLKVVILAGGYGTRISEETHIRPKPMVQIGDHPILWNIMKVFSHFGLHEFIICLGYKGEVIKDYFSNYFLYNSDVTFDLQNNSTIYHNHHTEPWKVTLVDTGMDSMTGGRIKKIQQYVKDEAFLLTYGDGVANINIDALIQFHQAHRKLATITAVQPIGRFGSLSLNDENQVHAFREKLKGDGGWVNGGYFVLEPEIFSYIENASTIFEKEPLEMLANDGQLMAYKHTGFWYAMDTLRDKKYLEQLWQTGKAPWKIWN